MESGTTQNETISAIDQNRQQIVSDLLDRVYQDPFWDERFGPQGRVFAEQDANQHLDNLQIALRFKMGETTTHHYNYLQNILVNRGVCTRLIKDSIDKLKLSIMQILPDHWDEIQPYLEAGYTGIAYSDPVSQALTVLENSLTEAVVERLLADSQFSNSDPDWQAARFRDIHMLISYLADALERRSVPIFGDYFEWLAANQKKQGLSTELLDREINLLSKEITRNLVPEHARRLRSLIRQVTRA